MPLFVEPKSRTRNLLLIPTYNCAPQIEGLVESMSLLASNWDAIWFVDNGSTDGTVNQIRISIGSHLSDSKHIRIFKNSENIGLGGTHKVALKKAIEDRFTTVTIFHGDHQAELIDAIKALELSRVNPHSFILGSRFMKDSNLVGYSKLRATFNKIMNVLFSAILMRIVRDLGSGLNIFPTSQIENIEFEKLPNDLTFNIEFLKWLSLEKKNIIWFPIRWVEEDQISNVKALNQIVKTIALAVLPFGKLGAAVGPKVHQIEMKIDGE